MTDPKKTDPQKNIARILGKIVGAGQDALYYWALYQSTPKNQFAVIKISGECLENSLDALVEDISDMYGLGLIPVITHGWGKSLTGRLKIAGLESSFVDGERYTDKRVMEEVEKIAQENLEALFMALINRGVNVTALKPEDRVIVAEDKEDERYGNHNGNIVEVNTKPIFSAIERGFLPVISPVGVSRRRGKHYNLNAATVGAEIARAIDPVNYVMITGIGGVFRDETMTEIASELILRREYDQMVASGILKGGMKKNVDEAKQCLDSRVNGEDRSVQIIGPGNLLRELFSRKGAGTYVRQGYDITAEPMEMFDRERIKNLVERVFGSSLKKSFFTESRKQAHLATDYKGIAVVIENPIESENPQTDLIDYIDMLAVDPRYEGNGLDTDLIHSVLTTQPRKEESNVATNGNKKRNGNSRIKVFWRSKITRVDVNDDYNDIAEGKWQYEGKDGEKYNLYWIGLTRDEVGKALAYVRNRPINFKK